MKNAHQHIEDYLAGKLTGEKLAAFEIALDNDAELRSVVDNYSALEKVADGMLENELEDELKELRNEYKGQSSKQWSRKLHLRNNRKWWLAAAAIIGLGVFGPMVYWELNPSFDFTMAEVYNKKGEPNWPSARNIDSPNLPFEEKAYLEYSKGNLPKAKTILLDSIVDKELGKYWLSEIYLKEILPDSALKYLPNFDTNHPRIENAKLLEATALAMKGEWKRAFRVYPPLKALINS